MAFGLVDGSGLVEGGGKGGLREGVGGGEEGEGGEGQGGEVHCGGSWKCGEVVRW